MEIVIDVRAVAASRRAGFSKKLLGAGLEDAGIGYLHLPQLGTPKPGRLAARAGRIAEMREIFAAHMEDPEAQHALAYAAEVAGQRRAALLCYCAEAPRCHRHIVSAMIAERTGLEVIDL